MLGGMTTRSRGARVGLAALGAAALLLGLAGLVRVVWPGRYPAKTTGRLVAGAQGGVSRTAEAEYLFSVNDRRYTVKGEVPEAERLVPVWYDPDDPREAAFQEQRPRRPGLLALGLAAVLGAAALGLARRSDPERARSGAATLPA